MSFKELTRMVQLRTQMQLFLSGMHSAYSGMGSLGTPGDFQITLSAVDKGRSHSTSSMDL